MTNNPTDDELTQFAAEKLNTPIRKVADVWVEVTAGTDFKPLTDGNLMLRHRSGRHK